LGRLYVRVHLWWVSRWIRRLLVVTGAWCPLTKPVVAAVELQATTEPHCSQGVQPGGICAYAVNRESTPGGPGPGLRPGRKRFLCQLPLWFYKRLLCQLPLWFYIHILPPPCSPRLNALPLWLYIHIFPPPCSPRLNTHECITCHTRCTHRPIDNSTPCGSFSLQSLLWPCRPLLQPKSRLLQHHGTRFRV
jgi:hypothetical protein